jgi:uncharacterized protein involved in exopolysaccharide biosynthesis
MEESLRLLKPYLRGLPLIVFAMVAGYMIMAQYLNYVTPKYESVTRLRLADINEGVPNSNLYKDFDVFSTSNKIAAEVEILKSELLINNALDRLDFDTEIFRVGKMRSTELYDNSPVMVEFLLLDDRLHDRMFNLHLHDDMTFKLVHPDGQELDAVLGDTLDVKGGKLLLSLNTPYIDSRESIDIADHYQFKKMSRMKLVSQVKEALSVMPVDKDVPVIRLIYTSPHPVKAARFPDLLAKTYIDDYIKTKSEAARLTMNFLGEQVNDVNQKLSQIELDIQNYRNKEEITNIHQESETLLREISQMRIQQTNLAMSMKAINELNEYITAGSDNFAELAPNFEAFTDLLSTELVKKANELRAEKRDLLLVYTPQDKRVQVIDEKLDDVYSYLIESISNTRRNLEIKHENLSRDIQLTELQLIDYPEKERRLTILKREFEIYQESYNFLNEKNIEAEIAFAASMSFHRIIEHARIAESPFSPNYIILKIVAAMLAGGGTIVLIFLVHAIKARVNDKLTIQSSSTVPVVAATPKLKSIDELQGHFLHQVNQLEVKKLIQPGSIVTLNAFTAAEGAHFHALHAAEALSRQNRSVLLVDAGNLSGLNPLQAGDVHPINDNLSVVHLDHPNYSFYTNEQIAELVKSLAKRFDVTVVSNALLGSQLSLQLMKASDANLVVLDSRRTPAKQVPMVDLIKDEYQIGEIYFILNRSGYNPNIIIEVAGWIIKKFGRKNNMFDTLTYA